MTSIRQPDPTTIIIEDKSDGFPDQSSEKRSVQQLSHMVQLLDITPKQKDKIQEFIKSREKIGDFTNEDLSIDGELGSGNGGVVLKVRHRKTGIDMAKKVIYFVKTKIRSMKNLNF